MCEQSSGLRFSQSRLSRPHITLRAPEVTQSQTQLPCTLRLIYTPHNPYTPHSPYTPLSVSTSGIDPATNSIDHTVTDLQFRADCTPESEECRSI